MKRNFLIALGLVIVLAVSLVAYGVYVNYAGETVISDRMSKRSISITASQVKYRPIQPEYMVRDATFEAQNAIDIIAKADGVIQKSYLHKNMPLKPGDAVMELINEDIPLKIASASAAMKKAEAARIRAEHSYERYQRLIDLDATSMEKLDEAKANYEAAIAAMDDAAAQLQQANLMQNRLHVTSTASGTVMVIYKQEGNYVPAGTPLCMVADFSSMWFAVNMTDKELKCLLGNGGASSHFRMTSPAIGDKKAYNTEYNGKNKGRATSFAVNVFGIYPALTEPADMRRVVFNVDNSVGVLEPHIYGFVTLTAQESRSALTVDARALATNNDADNVYVVTKDNTLELRQVEVGARTEKLAEILYGLNEGDIVVISGTEGLADGQKVDISYMEEN